VIKDLLPQQMVCSEKGEKGKPCHGKLKRYYPFASYFNETDSNRLEEIKREFGQDPKLTLLRCEDCLTIYRLPDTLKEKLNLPT
jgi:hypothetical protein